MEDAKREDREGNAPCMDDDPSRSSRFFRAFTIQTLAP